MKSRVWTASILAYVMILLLLILILSISPSAFAYPYDYMYRNPTPTIIIESSVSPEVLMAGDRGIVSMVIKNSADQHVVSYQEEDFALSVPIYRAELSGISGLEVTTGPYKEIGTIGPGDEITIYFNIKAEENITDGTYFLDVGLQSGFEEAPEKINRKIPVKVDSTNVALIRSKSSTTTSVSIDVANPRQNTLSAVTIVPNASGIEFSPEEYYIGTMEPDEIFTIDFDLNAVAPAGDVNMSFKSRFKNGDTWHESEVCNITLKGSANIQANSMSTPRKSGIGTTTAAAAVLLSTIIGGAYFWFRRTKKS